MKARQLRGCQWELHHCSIVYTVVATLSPEQGDSDIKFGQCRHFYFSVTGC